MIQINVSNSSMHIKKQKYKFDYRGGEIIIKSQRKNKNDIKYKS